MKPIIAIGYVFTVVNNEIKILACKRGEGAKNEPNKWCIPGGHFEDNESIPQCVSREVYEETGVHIDPYRWELVDIDSEPDKNFIVLNYCMVLHNMPATTIIHCEKDEISEVRYINIEDISTYDWAFGDEFIVNIENSLNKATEMFSFY